jgi:hypothetical protein
VHQTRRILPERAASLRTAAKASLKTDDGSLSFAADATSRRFSSPLKKVGRPFDKLRVSENGLRKWGGDPLMLSLSKHGRGFFNGLLATKTTKITQKNPTLTEPFVIFVFSVAIFSRVLAEGALVGLRAPARAGNRCTPWLFLCDGGAN